MSNLPLFLIIIAVTVCIAGIFVYLMWRDFSSEFDCDDLVQDEIGKLRYD